MLVLFDIGGTYFRYYISDYDGNIKYHYKKTRDNDVIAQLNKSIKNIANNYGIDGDKFICEIDEIRVSIAGIIDKYRISGCMNAGIPDNTELLKEINLYNRDEVIKIKYINDGDAFILGEVQYNNIQQENKNILGIVFGTGVGCGLIINGKLINNCEVHRYLEPFMKENKLNYDNIISVCKFLANEFTKLIELLNLDYLIINGYINDYSLAKDIINKFLAHNKYYNTKIIFSDCDLPNINGLLTL
mgnify:FL=1|jgi:hypothetical protein